MIRMCFMCRSEELCSHREEGLLAFYRAQLPPPVKVVTFGIPRISAARAETLKNETDSERTVSA